MAISLALAGALSLASNFAQAQQQFSGNWSVEVVTEQGTCNRAYRYPVMIENGAVRSNGPQGSNGPEGFNVSGRVQANGHIQTNIQRNLTRAEITGRLSDRSGSGTWTTSGAVICSGGWNAQTGLVQRGSADHLSISHPLPCSDFPG